MWSKLAFLMNSRVVKETKAKLELAKKLPSASSPAISTQIPASYLLPEEAELKGFVFLQKNEVDLLCPRAFTGHPNFANLPKTEQILYLRVDKLDFLANKILEKVFCCCCLGNRKSKDLTPPPSSPPPPRKIVLLLLIRKHQGTRI